MGVVMEAAITSASKFSVVTSIMLGNISGGGG
jgi:hypothetical protein